MAKKNHMKCIREGKAAFLAGLKRCPYKRGGWCWSWWRSGWLREYTDTRYPKHDWYHYPKH